MTDAVFCCSEALLSCAVIFVPFDAAMRLPRTVPPKPASPERTTAQAQITATALVEPEDFFFCFLAGA